MIVRNLVIAALAGLWLQKLLPSAQSYGSAQLPTLVVSRKQLGSVSFENSILGPEALRLDAATGDVYTGTADGILWRIKLRKSASHSGSGAGYRINAQKVMRVSLEAAALDAPECQDPFTPSHNETHCGRLLGFVLERDAENNRSLTLTGCDGARGLIRIPNVDSDSPGPVQTLAAGGGNPLFFCNDIAATKDGYWLTDSAMVPREKFAEALLSGEPGGRLFFFDKVSRQLQLRVSKLLFANGIFAAHDGRLFVAQTAKGTLGLVTRKRPEDGNVADDDEYVLRPFASLPIEPDNISPAPGTHAVRVAGTGVRTAARRLLWEQSPLIRRLISALPAGLQSKILVSAVKSGGAYVDVDLRSGAVTKFVETGSKGVNALSESLQLPSGITLFGSYWPAQPLGVSVTAP